MKNDIFNNFKLPFMITFVQTISPIESIFVLIYWVDIIIPVNERVVLSTVIWVIATSLTSTTAIASTLVESSTTLVRAIEPFNRSALTNEVIIT